MLDNKESFDYCFVISDLLSTTPRAYRAILSLLEEGYSVYLSCNVRRFSAYAYHKELIQNLAEFKFSYSETIWKNSKISTIFFKIIHKFVRKIHSKRSLKHKLLLQLANDFAIIQQYNSCKQIKAKVYVGHRPASLPVITKLAKKYSAKVWFDIEDYHFEESTDENENRMMTEFIKVFTDAKIYYTNASELIGKAYLEQLGISEESIEILNTPIIEDFPKENKKENKLSFVWFSQTVTFNRGLEEFLEAVKELKLACRIELIGNVDSEFEKYIQSLELSAFAEINLHGFIPEQQINEIVYNSDIGLALELDSVDRSRNLAITNKILTYAVLGNYILASDTAGQVNFINRIAENGKLITLSSSELIEFLNFSTLKKTSIREKKQSRIANASIFNIEVLKKKLVIISRFFF